ncbi:MAG TPA: AMIN domain-containing protein, partial [Burkholderiales bacterium]|nr:AMIN domain-containing protein [Burkholderiales bacterium]
MREALKRWNLMLFSAALLLAPRAFAVDIDSARIWPAEDYTRLTLESKAPLHQKLLLIEHPDRLVLDLEGVEMNDALKALPS